MAAGGFTGTIPAEVCQLTNLNSWNFEGNSFPCYPGCISVLSADLHNSIISIPRCATPQEQAICGFIAATDIAADGNCGMWVCDADGIPTTDPCATSAVWHSISCSGDAVNIIDLSNTVSTISGKCVCPCDVNIISYHLASDVTGE